MKMKKFLYYTTFLVLLLITYSCDQKIDNMYEGKSRIQFMYYTLDYNKKMVPITKQTFSFGMRPDNVEADTAKIIVEYLGTPSDVDRSYNVNIFKDSTTAVEGTHYKKFEKKQIFKAGKLRDTLKILVYRKDLSSSFTNPQDVLLGLELEASDDFDLGMRDGLRATLHINNYLSEPVWWSSSLRYDYIGFYHPKKWKILISFNSRFANVETCPFDVNNEGRSYFTGLANYLNAIPTFDDETGARIYIDRMVMPGN